jgi:hypothetical protein
MNVYSFLNMDDQDQHRKKRLELLIASPPYSGDRTKFIHKAGLTKGRISQLLDPGEAFGERAAKALAERLGLSDARWFDQGAISERGVWPFALITPDQLLTLPPEHLETVQKVALDLLRSTKASTQTLGTSVDTSLPRRSGLTGTIPKPPDLSKVESAAQRSEFTIKGRKAGNGRSG